MNPYQLSTAITAIAVWIAERVNHSQLELWAAIFTQLGDTLATIAVQRQRCCDYSGKQENLPSSFH